MARIDTIRECFDYCDWAHERLLAISADLGPQQLNQPFEMGPGSLHATLAHIYGAERTWLERWHARPSAFPRSSALETLAALATAFSAMSDARRNELSTATDGDLNATITYTTTQGRTHTNRLRDILLHVCNHAAHHRAQATNMLRRLGAPYEWIDYLAMKMKHAGDPRVDLETLRDFFRYTDWANDRVLTAAAALSDEQLDRPFDMGLGTLRKTLLHIRDAECWWYGNWTNGPDRPFPKLEAQTRVAAIRESFHQAAEQRNAYIALGHADMARPVSAQPRPDRVLTFKLGETLLQLCHHSTHHRAQAANMLRHVGATPPELDYVHMLREGQSQ